MKGNCDICGTEIDIQMCCSGDQCGCMGMPVEPPVCSEKCWNEYELKIKSKCTQSMIDLPEILPGK